MPSGSSLTPSRPSFVTRLPLLSKMTRLGMPWTLNFAPSFAAWPEVKGSARLHSCVLKYAIILSSVSSFEAKTTATFLAAAFLRTHAPNSGVNCLHGGHCKRGAGELRRRIAEVIHMYMNCLGRVRSVVNVPSGLKTAKLRNLHLIVQLTLLQYCHLCAQAVAREVAPSAAQCVNHAS